MASEKTVDDAGVGARRAFVGAAGLGGMLLASGCSNNAVAADGPKADTCCSLVPYFEVNEGKMEEFKALGPKFIELTRKEPGCLYYGFSFSGSMAHCREGYVSADAILAHLADVDAPLKQALGISKLVRLEVHGPAAELDKLRTPLAGLNPQYFTLAEGGFRV